MELISLGHAFDYFTNHFTDRLARLETQNSMIDRRITNLVERFEDRISRLETQAQMLERIEARIKRLEALESPTDPWSQLEQGDKNLILKALLECSDCNTTVNAFLNLRAKLQGKAHYQPALDEYYKDEGWT